MSIFRVAKNKENPYLVMNKYGLQDKTLSWKAKGILAYLLSLPDDWKIYESELQDHAKDGRDSLAAGIKELMEHDYIHRERIRDKKGRVKDYEYRVYEVPTCSGFSCVGKTCVGESTTTNNESIVNNNNNIYSGGDFLIMDEFLGIWSRQYQFKVGREPEITDKDKERLFSVIKAGVTELDFHRQVKEYLAKKRNKYSLEDMLKATA